MLINNKNLSLIIILTIFLAYTNLCIAIDKDELINEFYAQN